MSTKQDTIASFVEAAPPGELRNVVSDIKALVGTQVPSFEAALKKYNEEQYTRVKLPGGGENVIVSSYNVLSDGRYFDTGSQTSFELDHDSLEVTNTQSYSLESSQATLIQSLLKSFQTASAEHFPNYTIGVYPGSDNSSVILLLAANKYSPQNYWNGRWRSTYTLDASSNSVTGSIKVDVHYYEDGNVRMTTSKKVQFSSTSGAEVVIKDIAKAENKFQEELNRSFATLAEGSFKGLRRQLPVTRQRVDWDKIGGYRLGQDIGGGRSK